MLDSVQIEARKIMIEQFNKVIEKYQKKAEKEKEKKSNASVKYKGIEYKTDADLQDAYSCDFFDSETYDRLSEKLQKARGNVESYELTPGQQMVMELMKLKGDYEADLRMDEILKKRSEEHEKRFQELQAEGYSYSECNAIISNEERMRFE